jgi:DNA-binding NarL/FixJ family response regulator
MRVVIVADNALAAEAIRHGLRHAPSCRVLGYVNSRHSYADSLRDAAPELVVLDEGMRDNEALERIRALRGVVPEAKLILLSTSMDPSWLGQAAASGVDAVISKAAQPASIGMLVREVAAGTVFHAFQQAPIMSPGIPDAASHLTARELEILRLVAAGKPNSQIAAKLWVTEQTVKFHLSNIYRKLGVANRTEASHFAHLHRMLDPATSAGTGPSVAVAA